MAERKAPGQDEQRNEGEGNRTADRRYREGAEEKVRRGGVEEDAARAARDLDEHPEELRRAEEAGRSHSAGEAPGDLKPAAKKKHPGREGGGGD